MQTAVVFGDTERYEVQLGLKLTPKTIERVFELNTRQRAAVCRLLCVRALTRQHQMSDEEPARQNRTSEFHLLADRNVPTFHQLLFS